MQFTTIKPEIETKSDEGSSNPASVISSANRLVMLFLRGASAAVLRVRQRPCPEASLFVSMMTWRPADRIKGVIASVRRPVKVTVAGTGQLDEPTIYSDVKG